MGRVLSKVNQRFSEGDKTYAGRLLWCMATFEGVWVGQSPADLLRFIEVGVIHPAANLTAWRV